MKNGKIDAEITAEDGKIDINCGGGPTGNQTNQRKVYQLLSALTLSPRYNGPLLEAQRRRASSSIAPIWPPGSSTGPIRTSRCSSFEAGMSGTEDYRYDARDDPYKAHNGFYDTADEVGLVRGHGRQLPRGLPALPDRCTRAIPACRVNLATGQGRLHAAAGGPHPRGAAQGSQQAAQPIPPCSTTTASTPSPASCASAAPPVGFDSVNTIVQVLTTRPPPSPATIPATR
jgi:hypothetical protein